MAPQITTQGRVLLVEAASDENYGLRALLEQEYELLVCRDGRQTLDQAALEQPDLVILETDLPDMDGYEVCARLRTNAITADLPIMFVSNRGDVSHQARGLELGAMDYVTKPFHPSLVRARVRNYIEAKRNRDALRALSYTDGLTQVANRRHFENQLKAEWRRCSRSNSWLSVLLIDIDCFKQYNDRYGHPAGDACLRAVAQAISDQLQRPADLCARYGGEEFVCLLPETPPLGAEVLASHITRAIALLDIEHSDSLAGSRVTLSQGIGSVVPLGESPLLLLESADRALYKAKRDGRNRVCRGTIDRDGSDTLQRYERSVTAVGRRTLKAR